MNPTNAKSFLTSKKVWFNALTIIFVIATSFGYTPDQVVANQASNILLVAAPVINLILGLFFTKQPIVLQTPASLSA